jgi:hemerythrin-like domain-containing protein
MSSKQQTLTQAIAEDHQEMYEYYDQYQKAAGNADAQERWARQLIWEIARHAVGEEIVVYPLMEKHLGEQGKKQADHDREEHQDVKEMLYKIESLTPATEEYSALLKQVMDHLRHHNDEEEQKDLPLLEPAIGEEASRQAAAEFTRTKKFVPTRAHPGAPNQPPLETLAGFLAAPIDKLKDAFAKFPTQEMKDSV